MGADGGALWGMLEYSSIPVLLDNWFVYYHGLSPYLLIQYLLV